MIRRPGVGLDNAACLVAEALKLLAFDFFLRDLECRFAGLVPDSGWATVFLVNEATHFSVATIPRNPLGRYSTTIGGFAYLTNARADILLRHRFLSFPDRIQPACVCSATHYI